MAEPNLYPTHRRAEGIALGLVLLVLIGLPLGIFVSRWLGTKGNVRVIELVGRLPTSEHGGWTPETITVQKGERVRLRLTSADVVHGFSIPKLGLDAGWVEPGKVKDIELTVDQPGRYTFLCTTWCESGHWRMRGVLEVIDPNDAAASAGDVSPPQTDWMAAGLDIDAEHPGPVYPFERPSAGRGEVVWSRISDRPVTGLLTTLDLRRTSPADVFTRLADPALPEARKLADLTFAERWDLVAYLWRSAIPADALSVGARLYARDCTGCHGGSGQGDGPGAEALSDMQHQAGQHESMARSVVDFTNLEMQAGAPDLLYYGKIVRGGMGTNMPYWGTVYTEDELWAVIAHLRGFAFGP